MPRTPIVSHAAPAAIGPYSQGVQIGNLIFTSGQLPATADGAIIMDDIAAATGQSLDNVRAVVEAAGADLDDVVKVTIYLRDMADFAAMNEVYATYFGDPAPARSCVQVARLPKDAPLEIEAIAVRST